MQGGEGSHTVGGFWDIMLSPVECEMEDHRFFKDSFERCLELAVPCSRVKDALMRVFSYIRRIILILCVMECIESTWVTSEERLCITHEA